MSNALVVKFAEKFSVDQNQVLATLKATCFKGPATDAQITALMIVADQYGLNPWTKEIYAFPDKNNGIVPVVGVDGWSRIINENPQFDGMDFNEGGKGDMPDWIECVIYRKDRSHPIKLKEYMAECKRPAGPWQSHPRRMLRHKAMIQCARLAFGYVGIFDQDEAERITEGDGRAAPRDMGNAEVVNLVDIEPMLLEVAATKTDADALAYWKANNGRLSKQPNDHKRLKDAISTHRANLQKTDEARTVEMPAAKPAQAQPIDDEFVAALGPEYAPE